MLKPLIVIVGPTATGKTALAIELAKKFSLEIISGDSMQVYRYMDIGTAKATKDEQQGIPHHMIDILDPNQEFSVAIFQSKVEDLITDINNRGKLPVLVGGTGLYIRSVIDHYDFTEFAVDWELRQVLHEEAKEKGNEFLHNKLALVDPAAAEKIHPNNLRRVIRALEVVEQTGNPISQYQTIDENKEPKYNLRMYGLYRARETLYDGINNRVDNMIEKGLVEEVRSLLAKDYNPTLTSMQAIGYKEIISYLQGECTLEEAVEILKRNTRRFAKRQLTWFRRDKRIKWFELIDDKSLAKITTQINEEVCRRILKKRE